MEVLGSAGERRRVSDGARREVSEHYRADRIHLSLAALYHDAISRVEHATP